MTSYGGALLPQGQHRVIPWGFARTAPPPHFSSALPPIGNCSQKARATEYNFSINSDSYSKVSGLFESKSANLAKRL